MTIRYPCWGVMAVLAWALSGPSAGTAETLSLQQAVDAALKNNPMIASQQLSAEAARHAARGAKALTNPELTVAPTVLGEAGSDSELFFSQPLEINGSRRVRGEIAEQEATAATYDAVTVRRDIILRIRQLYWDVVRSQDMVTLNQDNIRYLQGLNQAAQKQLDVGAIPGSQLVKTEVELARARQELALAQLELAQSKSALNSLLNRPHNSDFSPTDPLVFSPVAIDKAKLSDTAAKQRPEIASSQAELNAARQRIKEASLRRSPDLALQARKETFDGEGGVAVAVSLPILDWGSVRSDKQRAEKMALSRDKQLEAARNAVALDVQQAVQSYETTSAVVLEYQGGILDKSQQLAEMAQKGYEKGATSYLEVLEAQRTLRNTRTAYLSALADHARAIAQLDWATGAPFGGG